MVNDARSGGSSNFMVNETRGSDNFRLDHEKSIGQQNFQVGLNSAKSSAFDVNERTGGTVVNQQQ